MNHRCNEEEWKQLQRENVGIHTKRLVVKEYEQVVLTLRPASGCYRHFWLNAGKNKRFNGIYYMEICVMCGEARRMLDGLHEYFEGVFDEDDYMNDYVQKGEEEYYLKNKKVRKFIVSALRGYENVI